jgi:hypothetical protein
MARPRAAGPVFIPNAVPTAIKSSRFTGTLHSLSRVMVTEDAKFALGF